MDAAQGLEAMAEPFGVAPSGRERAQGSAHEAVAGALGPRARLYREGGLVLALAGDPWLEDPPAGLGLLPALAARYRADPRRVPETLHGPFALVILDSMTGAALLAVDRIGIETLCHARIAGGLLFASRADAIAAHPRAAARLDPQGLFNYLYFHCVPCPQAVYQGQRKLLPGQWVYYADGRLTEGFYWAMAYRDPPTPEAPLRAEFLATLEQCVARAAEGVAPEHLGAFLSGGTDSSTVAGLLTRIQGQPARTFSIGFAATGYDEMDYARIAERHFGLAAQHYYVTPEDVLAAIPRLAAAFDEPFANASAVPALFCAELARRHGVHTLLGGDGGDEIFGGNARYAQQLLFETYGRLPETVRRILLEPLAGVPGADRLPPLRKLGSFIRQSRVPLPDRMESYNFLHRTPLAEMFTAEFLQDIDPEAPLENLREVYGRAATQDPLNRMLHLDMKLTLADNDLRKVSRMGELAGVEVRYPLLDEAFVELSGRVPPDLKIRWFKLRYFFKRALAEVLPREILTKKKHGFGLPAGLWLRDHPDLRQRARGGLTSFKARGILRPAYIDDLLERHERVHPQYFGVMVWVLLMLEEWLQHRRL